MQRLKTLLPRPRMALDYAMPPLFLYLMSYRAGRGLWMHGILGCTLLALFVLHHALNWRWHRGLLRGRYGAPRMVFIGINVLLSLALLAMLASAVLLFGEVFDIELVDSERFNVARSGRKLHTIAAAWGFTLAALHTGLHTHAMLRRAAKALQGKRLRLLCWRVAFLAVFAAGIWAFAQSTLWQDMFLLPHGNPPFSPAAFYARYLLIALAGCQTTHLLLQAARRLAG